MRPATPGGELPELVATLAARVTALPVDDGSRYSVRRLTVGWLLEAASVHTQAAHLRDLDAYLGWCARERLDPVTARPTDLAQFRVWRELQGTGGRAAAASTVARALASVSSWYTHLVANSDDRVSRNPAAAAKRPRVNAHTSTTAGLTLTEVDLLLAQADAEADERTARFSWYARWLMFAPCASGPEHPSTIPSIIAASRAAAARTVSIGRYGRAQRGRGLAGWTSPPRAAHRRPELERRVRLRLDQLRLSESGNVERSMGGRRTPYR